MQTVWTFSVTDAERFEIRWCWITGSAENHRLPAAIVCLSSHLRKTISWMIIIKGLAVVFWKIPIILTFLSCFLFLFEKKAMIESQTNKKPYFDDSVWYILSLPIPFSKMGQNRNLFPLKMSFLFFIRGHVKKMLSKSVSRSFRGIFQMFPFKLLQVNS